MIFPLRVKIANLIKIRGEKKRNWVQINLKTSTYQIDAKAVRVEPLLAEIACDHVLRLRLLADAEELEGYRWVNDWKYCLTLWKSAGRTHDNESVGIC